MSNSPSPSNVVYISIVSVSINRGRTYQALHDTGDKTLHDQYGQQTQPTTHTQIRRLTTCSLRKISLGTTNTQNTRATAACVIDIEVVGDLHGASSDGGRGRQRC